MMRSIVARSAASGFSQTTCLPAAKASTMTASWAAGGVHTTTTSTSGRSTSSRWSFVAYGTKHASVAARRRWSSTSATPTRRSRPPSMASAAACSVNTTPVPTMPTPLTMVLRSARRLPGVITGRRSASQPARPPRRRPDHEIARRRRIVTGRRRHPPPSCHLTTRDRERSRRRQSASGDDEASTRRRRRQRSGCRRAIRRRGPAVSGRRDLSRGSRRAA